MINMIKADLKDGMIVEVREGYECIVLHNKLLKWDEGHYYKRITHLDNYREDLKHNRNELIDIMKVYDRDHNLIWERDETDWSKVAVDTKVIVSCLRFDTHKRYFAKYEDGIVYTFPYGCDSWTYNKDEGNGLTAWKHAKIFKK